MVREVNLSHAVISTVAGNYGSAPATAAMAGRPPPPSLTTPTGVAVDAQGDLFITDRGNNVVREVELVHAASSPRSPGTRTAATAAMAERPPVPA